MDVYQRLKVVAEIIHRPVTAVARAAIREWLLARERETVKADIQRYASAVAGTDQDLDPLLEKAATEYLVREASQPWRKSGLLRRSRDVGYEGRAPRRRS